MTRLGLGAVERDNGRIPGRYLGRRLHLERFRREGIARVRDALDVLYRRRFGRGGREDGRGRGAVCGRCGFGLWLWLWLVLVLWLWLGFRGVPIGGGRDGRGRDGAGVACHPM